MTTEIMLSRMQAYGVIGLSQTASPIMGGVFATAAVTFIEILQGHDALPRPRDWLAPRGHRLLAGLRHRIPLEVGA
jgi:hypothetical protein